MSKSLKFIFSLALVAIVSSVTTGSNSNKAHSLGFVTVSGRVAGFDGSPVVNAKVVSDELFANRVDTCTDTNGNFQLTIPASTTRYLRVYLTSEKKGNSNVDCGSQTTGIIPTLSCWIEYGPFTTAVDIVANSIVQEMKIWTIRVVDGDGYPYLGARIGNGGLVNGSSGPCPMSSTGLPIRRSFMDDFGHGDSDMDGVIELMGTQPFSKTITVSAPSSSGTSSLGSRSVTFLSSTQTVELPIRQSVPVTPHQILISSNGVGSVLANVSLTNDPKSVVSKIRVSSNVGSLGCDIELLRDTQLQGRNFTSGGCSIAGLLPGNSYVFSATAINGRGSSVALNSTSFQVPTDQSTKSVPIGQVASGNTQVSPIVVKVGRSRSVLSILRAASVLVPRASKLSTSVSTKSRKVCRVSGAGIKGLKVGVCTFKITMKPRKGKAISKTLTLKVSK